MGLDLDRNDLLLEAAGRDRGRGALVAERGELVLLFARDAVAGRDVLGADAHVRTSVAWCAATAVSVLAGGASGSYSMGFANRFAGSRTAHNMGLLVALFARYGQDARRLESW